MERRQAHIRRQLRAREEVEMLARVTGALEQEDRRRKITPHLLFTEFFEAYRLAENYATAAKEELTLEERRRFTESGSRTAALEESDVDVLNQWLHADAFGGNIGYGFDGSWVIKPQMR